MPVDVDNEVERALMLRLRNNATVRGLVATVVSPAGPAIFLGELPSACPGFPKIIVNDPAKGLRGTDFEGWEGGRFTVVFDIFGPDLSTLKPVAGAIDREITIVQPVDTGNFVLTILARTSPWRSLKYRDEDQARGNIVYQYTADWLLVAGRKQGA